MGGLNSNKKTAWIWEAKHLGYKFPHAVANKSLPSYNICVVCSYVHTIYVRVWSIIHIFEGFGKGKNIK